MQTANKPLNSQALALEQAETKIRVTVKKVLSGTPKETIDKEVTKIIRDAVSRLIQPLKAASVRSLINFYNRQFQTILRLSGGDYLLLLLMNKLTEPGVPPYERAKIYSKLQQRRYTFNGSANVGVPNQKFMRNYVHEQVKPIIDRLAEQRALDPDDISGRNSLRNRAEMEARYAKHLEDIAGLRASGVRLVIASAHADCSKRCAPWQGKVFSLDGSYGRTEDGRSFQPIENATDVYYTTKVGKVYKNGLLGFNCRHYLVPFASGYRFPKPDAKEERRQRRITETQRQLERTVRRWEIKAIEAKGVDDKGYREALAKARGWRSKYVTYSRENGRAYYPSRLKII